MTVEADGRRGKMRQPHKLEYSDRRKMEEDVCYQRMVMEYCY